jgi:hypothetical protein
MEGQAMTDKERVHNLLEQADRMIVLTREFKRLAEAVTEYEVPEVYLAVVESAAKQVGETLSPVSAMVDMLSKLSPAPTPHRQFVCAPREVAYWRSVFN